jgi:hypothetical protein
MRRAKKKGFVLAKNNAISQTIRLIFQQGIPFLFFNLEPFSSFPQT